jgi:hypothetical protein
MLLAFESQADLRLSFNKLSDSSALCPVACFSGISSSNGYAETCVAHPLPLAVPVPVFGRKAA